MRCKMICIIGLLLSGPAWADELGALECQVLVDMERQTIENFRIANERQKEA